MRKTTRLIAAFALTVTGLALLLACSKGQEFPDPQETQAIAKQAYLYGFPMVMNYKTLYQYAIDTDSPDYKAPFNQVSWEGNGVRSCPKL